jgi:hypothetical protein
MSETYQFKLPFIEASQAQKHVTVNEALARLDAFAQLRVQSRIQPEPASPIDGQSYIVPAGAGGGWVGQDNAVALYSNGGWIFAPAQNGWIAWVLDEAAEVRFEGATWNNTDVLANPDLGSIDVNTIEFDHVLTAGSFNMTSVVIPNNAVVFGMSGRVVQAINGPSAFRVGVETSQSRYGTGLGVALNDAYVRVTSKPQAYYEDTPLRISQEGGVDFVDGVIRLCVHQVILTPPAAV